MKKIIFAITLMLAVNTADAQLSNYTFTHEGGQISYLDANDTAVRTHMVLDDFVLPAKVAIGFPFKFNGEFFDSVGISENGFIWFGTAQSDAMEGILNPLTSALPAGVKGVVCAFGIDLHPHQNTNLVTTIRSKTIVFGVNPGMFVVEWRNTSRIDAMNDAAGEDTIGFQIELFRFELDRIQITYGYDIGLNPNITSELSVGIKGASNSDFSVRMTDVTHDWNTNTAGPDLNATCTFSKQRNPGKAMFNYMTWLNTGGTGLENPAEANISIYPVPADNFIRINSDETFSSFQIIGLDARLYMNGNFSPELDITSLPSGVYLLRLEGNNGPAYRRIIKL